MEPEELASDVRIAFPAEITVLISGEIKIVISAAGQGSLSTSGARPDLDKSDPTDGDNGDDGDDGEDGDDGDGDGAGDDGDDGDDGGQLSTPAVEIKGVHPGAGQSPESPVIGDGATSLPAGDGTYDVIPTPSGQFQQNAPNAVQLINLNGVWTIIGVHISNT